MHTTRSTCFLILIACCLPFVSAQNIALNKPAIASSEEKAYPATNATDGKITRESRWISSQDARPPHILEIDLQKYYNVTSVVVHTGIPEPELTTSETGKAAGFWSAKHLKLQYWDDANWTDMPDTEIFENRQTEIRFNFTTAITTFRIRLISNDGERIRIIEVEVYGAPTPGMPLPPSLSSKIETKPQQLEDKNAEVTFTARRAGTSMKYVGYNQGYYLPGSNASAWVEYSGVNSLRVWATLNDYVPEKMVEVDLNLNDVSEFDKKKEKLRQTPENNPYINWKSILPVFSNPLPATNTMMFDYAISELKRMNIDVVLQISSTDFNDTWSNKWKQWQRYYVMAFYAAKTGDVEMYALQNEPNHRNSGPMTVEQWIGAMQIVSDAVRCAIEDVNRLYGKSLRPKLVGPVTAGSNNNWWAEIMKKVRTDYRGKTIDYDQIDIFSTHSYNLPAAGYTSKISDIRKILTEHHPQHRETPIVYTEIGRWMNAYLIDKEETMDSPSLFTEWAGIYTNNMLNGGYGMWAFKFANTTSSTYPRGIKSGHHLTWQGERIVEDAFANVAEGKKVKTSGGVGEKYVTDGDKSDRSTWTSLAKGEKWIEIDLGKKQTIGSAIIYTGSSYGVYTGPDRVQNLKLQYLNNNVWTDISGASETGIKYVQTYYPFKNPVETNKIRFISTDEGAIKVREIKLFKEQSLAKKQDYFDIAGIQRTGEVVRLFAKGFKNQRDLLETIVSVDDQDLDVCASFDAVGNCYYVWIVQRNMFTYTLNLNVSQWNIATGTPVTVEEVGHKHHGEVVRSETYNGGNLELNVPPQSVSLVAIPAARQLKKTVINPVADASVKGGKYAGKNFGTSETLAVELNSATKEKNQVIFITFDLSKIDVRNIEKAIVSMNGRNATDNAPFRTYMYAITDKPVNEKTLSWETAPNLDSEEAQVVFDSKIFVAGQIVLDENNQYRRLDVTDIVKGHVGQNVTFVVIRELRHLGDDMDKGRTGIIHSRESKFPPYLEIWEYYK